MKKISQYFLLIILTACATPKKPINTDEKNNEILTRTYAESGWEGVEAIFNSNSFIEDPNSSRPVRVINLRNRTFNLPRLKDAVKMDQDFFNRCQSAQASSVLKMCVPQLSKLFLSFEQKAIIPELQIKLEVIEKGEEQAKEVSKKENAIANSEKAKLRAEFQAIGCVTLGKAMDIVYEKQKHYLIEIPCFGRNLKTGECNLFQGMLYQSTTPAGLITLSSQPEKDLRLAWFVQKVGIRKFRLRDGQQVNIPIFIESKRCKEIVYKI